MSRSPFDSLADDYDRARPDYPHELYSALGDLGELTVLELGAGTGIATRGLQHAGARVLPTDLGIGMLRKQRGAQPRVVSVAECIPVRSASVDLVAGAQMWHWVDADKALPEVRRVLRPGGRLAVWWNEVDVDRAPWWEAQQARIEALNPAYRRDYRRKDWAADLCERPGVAGADTVTIAWARDLDPNTYRAWSRSKSYIAAIPEPARSELIRADEEVLAELFPEAVIREPFVCSLTLVTFQA